MDGWMYRLTDGWVYVRVHVCVSVLCLLTGAVPLIYGCLDVCMDVRIYGCMDVWMYGWMDVWMDGWVRSCVCMCVCAVPLDQSGLMYGCLDGWMDVSID